jgi:hypothetical protein
VRPDEPRFDPATYPGPRPDGPVLVADGHSTPVEDLHDLVGLGAVAPRRAAPGSGTEAADAWRWIVAYGANASPPRLVDKRLDRDGAVLLPAELRDHVPAFEARRTGYGAVPLTLVPSPGAVTATWVLGLRAASTALLDRTEGRLRGDLEVPADQPRHDHEPAADDGVHVAPPGTYRLARIGTVRVAGALVLEGALAYVPGPATRVQVVGDGWRTWPTWGQADAAAHVDRRGPALPAPAPAEVLVGPWPSTPLRWEGGEAAARQG